MRPHGPCGKKMYRSEHEARKDVRQMQKHKVREAEKLNVYVCVACRCYHVGHAGEVRR